MASKSIKNYDGILTNLKEKIRQARMRAVRSVNTELNSIYWEIGNTILLQQKNEGWGAKIIDKLAIDLKSEFPDMQGFSIRNIKYMRSFAEAYPNFLIVQLPVAQLQRGSNIKLIPAKARGKKGRQNDKSVIVQPVVAQLQQIVSLIPWTHNVVLLTRVKEQNQRLFYAQQTLQNGWSKNVLIHQIESGLYKRKGNAITNFDATLPRPQSDLARETLKNPYLFDFLAMGENFQERDLENALINHIKKFTLELGRGFAYVGNQYNLLVEDDDYFLDLLFYNYHLRCFVLFELKVGEFKPEYTGKLNFYINTVDAQMKGVDDKPTIGVLLCKTPNKTVVKYSLKGINTPMGVAEYKLLPENIKSEMPTIKELERELNNETKKFQKPVDKKLDSLKKLVETLNDPEVKEKKNTINTEKVFTKVLLPLKKQLLISLKGISKQFLETEIMIWMDTLGYDNENKAKQSLKKTKHYNEFRIGITFRGFRKAGIKSFDIWKDIYFSLQQHRYTISFSRNENETILMKLYHEMLTKKEIEILLDQFQEEIINNILQQIKHFIK